MARPTIDNIIALRTTAQKLESGADYQWGHMGSCNCGHLVQTITQLSKDEIHRRAMNGSGDWAEQTNNYCGQTGFHIDEIITQMTQAGFTQEDLIRLERLSDHDILRLLPIGERNLRHNDKGDVIRYLKAWAMLLEKELAEKLPMPSFQAATLAIPQ